MDDLRPGLRHTEAITVSEALTVPAVSTGFAGMPAVFPTAFMVGLVEWTYVEALRSHLAAYQRTVGTHVDMSHTAATPVGMQVTADVELLAVEGRRLRFRVECRDAREVIGSGFYERAVVDGDKFLERVRRKRGRRCSKSLSVGGSKRAVASRSTARSRAAARRRCFCTAFPRTSPCGPASPRGAA
ncbi:MAG TPA: thioesterase family protein [Acetobacteraceae bacterium]|nr:thioesterase family protein [Acetobacteraceae bacterium]